jgi:iron only hydrogenase large subunit-like protein
MYGFDSIVQVLTTEISWDFIRQRQYTAVSKEDEEAVGPATISLTDCLACSGCITTAESVLVAQQSDSEIYQVLERNLEAKNVRWME